MKELNTKAKEIEKFNIFQNKVSIIEILFPLLISTKENQKWLENQLENCSKTENKPTEKDLILKILKLLMILTQRNNNQDKQQKQNNNQNKQQKQNNNQNLTTKEIFWNGVINRFIYDDKKTKQPYFKNPWQMKKNKEVPCIAGALKYLYQNHLSNNISKELIKALEIIDKAKERLRKKKSKILKKLKKNKKAKTSNSSEKLVENKANPIFSEDYQYRIIFRSLRKNFPQNPETQNYKFSSTNRPQPRKIITNYRELIKLNKREFSTTFMKYESLQDGLVKTDETSEIDRKSKQLLEFKTNMQEIHEHIDRNFAIIIETFEPMLNDLNIEKESLNIEFQWYKDKISETNYYYNKYKTFIRKNSWLLGKHPTFLVVNKMRLRQIELRFYTELFYKRFLNNQHRLLSSYEIAFEQVGDSLVNTLESEDVFISNLINIIMDYKLNNLSKIPSTLDPLIDKHLRPLIINMVDDSLFNKSTYVERNRYKLRLKSMIKFIWYDLAKEYYKSLEHSTTKIASSYYKIKNPINAGTIKHIFRDMPAPKNLDTFPQKSIHSYFDDEFSSAEWGYLIIWIEQVMHLLDLFPRDYIRVGSESHKLTREKIFAFNFKIWVDLYKLEKRKKDEKHVKFWENRKDKKEISKEEVKGTLDDYSWHWSGMPTKMEADPGADPATVEPVEGEEEWKVVEKRKENLISSFKNRKKYYYKKW